MPDLPSPFRAAVGLAAVIVDEARRLPDRVIEVPMMAVSRALQLSLRAQQQYAALAARGEQVLHPPQVTDQPPEWATFDAPVDDELVEVALAEVAVEAALSDAFADAALADAVSDAALSDSLSDEGATTETIRAPRTGAPSAFDIVRDPDDDPETDDIVPDTD